MEYIYWTFLTTDFSYFIDFKLPFYSSQIKLVSFWLNQSVAFPHHLVLLVLYSCQLDEVT